jgi:hypothetical protein
MPDCCTSLPATAASVAAAAVVTKLDSAERQKRVVSEPAGRSFPCKVATRENDWCHCVRERVALLVEWAPISSQYGLVGRTNHFVENGRVVVVVVVALAVTSCLVGVIAVDRMFC